MVLPFESITHTINVLQTITFKTPRVEMTVADAIHVTPTILPTGPVFESVSDIIHLTDTITAPNVSTNRQSVTGTITVSQGIRQNLINIPVTDAVTVTPRLTNFDQFVASRLHVTTTLRRDWDENIVDTLPITEPSRVRLLATCSSLTRFRSWTPSFGRRSGRGR